MSSSSVDTVLTEIDAMVGEKLQICTYKTLCRCFGVPANTAKQILFEFAEKRRGEVSVVYCLTGISKETGLKSVQLVRDEKLAGRRSGLKSVSGMHVYSIQPRIPKDPSEIFANEKAAAEEEMLNLISGKDTYIADNRFSAVVAHHVKRDPTAAQLPSKPAAAPSAPTKETLPKAAAASVATAKASKPNLTATTTAPTSAKPTGEAEAKPVASGSVKRKEPPTKEGTKGSLGALWSKMPVKKSKAAEKVEGSKGSTPAAEAVDSSDDEAEEDPVQVMNKANRQRRVCMDDEDEEVEAMPSRPRARGVVLDDGNEEEENAPQTEGNCPEAEDVDMGEAIEEAAVAQPSKIGRKGGGKKGAGNRGKARGGGGDELNEAEEGGEERVKVGEDKKATGISAAFAKQGVTAGGTKGASQAAGKWVEKTFYDDKGNEVTELIFEVDPAGVSQSGSQQEGSQKAATASAGKPATEVVAKEAPSSTKAAKDLGGAKGAKESSGAKTAKESAASKSGKAAAGSGKQKGIMSFFGKK